MLKLNRSQTQIAQPTQPVSQSETLDFDMAFRVAGSELPYGWVIDLTMQAGFASVYLHDPRGNRVALPKGTPTHQLRVALAEAKRLAAASKIVVPAKELAPVKKPKGGKK